MKYLVMEARPSYAILLDEEGRFVRAANLHYEPGQTVEHIVPMRTRAPKSKGVLIWLPGVLAAACLVLMAAVLLRAPITPYASVYLTINPQVRIDVDRQSMTQGLEGVNQDGQDLVLPRCFYPHGVLVAGPPADIGIAKRTDQWASLLLGLRGRGDCPPSQARNTAV